jgi:hypothetical protein
LAMGQHAGAIMLFHYGRAALGSERTGM